MERKALTNKLLVLGIDGLDPRLTRKYVDSGIMPNTKKFIERGCQRHDLVLLGGVPTITPPMWATLATGTYPVTHGITDFFQPVPGRIDAMTYAMHSSSCQAEQIWNCFAEDGWKTLVWHWPSASCPPSSDSPNLHVVDGSSPGGVNMSTAQCDPEFFMIANEKADAVTYRPQGGNDVSTPCVVTDLKVSKKVEGKVGGKDVQAGMQNINYILEQGDGQGNVINKGYDIGLSPIKPATGWIEAPADAKEFVLLLAKGLVHRACLILKNENGVYDQIAVYKSKKESKPLYVLDKDVFYADIIDETFKNDELVHANRNMRLVELAEDGSKLKLYVSPTMNIAANDFWFPKTLHELVVSKIGYPPPTSMLYGHDPILKEKTMLECWQKSAQWQAASLNYLMQHEGYQAVFSHFHSVDLQGHTILSLLPNGAGEFSRADYEAFLEKEYIQADWYIGQFLHFLDEGWTILIVSDHALLAPKFGSRMLGDTVGINVRIMQELGLTALKVDENGNELREMDWEHTKAVAIRGNHIYINLKDKYPHGIVAPEDQWDVEEEVMTKLYGYKDKVTGQRIVSLALRNKDAILLGLGGPNSGDIIYFMAEGYNFEHGDSLSTLLGESDTSVSPIFLAAGQGIKQGQETNRIIREVDVAPTCAVLGGVRFPSTCEGAPAYQIFVEEI